MYSRSTSKDDKLKVNTPCLNSTRILTVNYEEVHDHLEVDLWRFIHNISQIGKYVEDLSVWAD